jgi:hypothetical protein
MPLTHRDNGVSMGGTLREVSTLKKMLHFGWLKRPAKLVLEKNQGRKPGKLEFAAFDGKKKKQSHD